MAYCLFSGSSLASISFNVGISAACSDKSVVLLWPHSCSSRSTDENHSTATWVFLLC